ncbi:hypothetical protein [Aquamicrobium sp. LC103]|uniref:hypothetical protein n=1 Tax=Aquamicrobium sp. LC103 TaxID=1120658 RepID=UPI00063EBFC5|nr:hypothetical protein [Aquamicrobium sp. LC103]TKT76101.1 hypothetical protein XW59_016085 [Aquamicrobium sp. LC103]
MTNKLKAGLVAAAIAAIIGLAVSYGLISRETGDAIKTQTDQILDQENTTNQPPATGNTDAQPSAQDNVSPSAPADTGTPPPATTAPEASQPSE